MFCFGSLADKTMSLPRTLSGNLPTRIDPTLDVRDEDGMEHSHGQHGSDPDKVEQQSPGLLIKKQYSLTSRNVRTLSIAQEKLVLDFPSHTRDKNVGFPVGRSTQSQETGSLCTSVGCGHVLRACFSRGCAA